MQIKQLYQQIFTPPINEFFLTLYLFSTALGLPWSSVFMSIGGIGLAFHWVISGRYSEKIKRLMKNKYLLPIALLFILHIIWLLNTTNFKYAVHDLKVKLPLLVVPFVLASFEPISKRNFHFIFKTFVFACLVSSLISLSVYLGIYKKTVNDIRDISIFVSHIRLGLMMLFSIIILCYFNFKSWQKWSYWSKAFNLLLIIWFMVFIIILRSNTSWIIGVVLIFYLFIASYRKIKFRWARISGIVALVSLPFVISITFLNVFRDFYTLKDNLKELPAFTAEGNKYYNDTVQKTIENGHLVYILVSSEELEQNWPKYSKIPFYGNDEKGQPVYGTLLRYLASKGLTKDKQGLSALSNEDINLIEKGYASCIYLNKSLLYLKLYEVLWEFDRYINHDDPNAKSICMRLEYLKIGKQISSNNFWFGVGSGDLADCFQDAYLKSKTKLIKEYWKRAHNQYFTFFITFGVFGFILTIGCFFMPLYFVKSRSLLLNAFAIIVFLSMINEDTLETQAGVTFFTFFYVILLIYSNQSYNNE
jgi:O-antigen ligase